jgi:hypothetical protein
VGIDLSGLDALTADIEGTRAVIEREGRAVVSKGALNIKNDWRTNAMASAGRHARLYPYTINYDIAQAGGVIEAEIGPDRSKDQLQAALGAILEFGSVKNAPHNDGGRALEAEEPRFQAAVQAVVDQAMA